MVMTRRTFTLLVLFLCLGCDGKEQKHQNLKDEIAATELLLKENRKKREKLYGQYSEKHRQYKQLIDGFLEASRRGDYSDPTSKQQRELLQQAEVIELEINELERRKKGLYEMLEELKARMKVVQKD